MIVQWKQTNKKNWNNFTSEIRSAMATLWMVIINLQQNLPTKNNNNNNNNNKTDFA